MEILIVEDNRQWSDWYVGNLRHEPTLLSLRPIVVVSYAEARGVLNATPIDCAIVDLWLASQTEPNNLHGLRLLDHLFEREIPALVATSFASPDIADAIYRNYGDMFQIIETAGITWERVAKYLQTFIQRRAGSWRGPSLISRPALTAREREEYMSIAVQRTHHAQQVSPFAISISGSAQGNIIHVGAGNVGTGHVSLDRRFVEDALALIKTSNDLDPVQKREGLLLVTELIQSLEAGKRLEPAGWRAWLAKTAPPVKKALSAIAQSVGIAESIKKLLSLGP